MSISYFNKEGYPDPTAYEALRRIELEAARDKKEKREEKYRRKRDQAEGYPLFIPDEPIYGEFLWEELANAVIFQAVCDWRDAWAALRKNPADEKALDTILETERFFLSKRFGKLTKLDGRELLDRLYLEG